MLSHLTIRDLAVFAEASFELSPGLNVLTGETGAGKSVIVDALELLRGAARCRVRVREGASTGSVEAQFVPTAESAGRLGELLGKYDLPLQEELVVARRLEASGRTRCYVQGRLVPRSVLAELGDELIEICGQHESHALRSPASQLAALDRFADVSDEVERYAGVHAAFRAAEAQLEEARGRSDAFAARLELIDFQLAELSQWPLGDYAEVKRRVELARSAAELEELALDVQRVLVDGDDALAERVGWLLKRTDALARSLGGGEDNAVRPVADCLSAVLDGLHQTARAAAVLARGGCLEPGELELSSGQLDEMERLSRKHRCAPEELAQLRERLEQELERCRTTEAGLPELERQVEILRRQTEQLAALLHERRCRAADALQTAVARELRALCLTGATLLVEVNPAPLSASGASQVSLRFSGSQGLVPAALGRVASGGELSRVLLALKVVSRHGLGTAVFDEIDAGAGGHVAARIGERLRDAARSSQVICVTHWPQVAAFADAHVFVHKAAGEAGAPDGRAMAASSVLRLEGERRIDELSRMLGGAGRSARGHATHLLDLARGDLPHRPGKAA